MTFDILIPAYNEAGNLLLIEERLIPQLVKDKIEFKIILVDDGSSDDTPSIADKMAGRREDFRVIHHKKNLGLGAALRTGYKNAENRWVISIDSDLSYSPDQILNLINAIEPGVDAVFGSPYMRGGLVKGVSQVRIIPSKGISMLYSVVMLNRLSCWTGMFRVIKRTAIQDITITQNGFDGVAEIAVRLAKRGYKIVEVPAILGQRTIGESKAFFLREFTKHLKQLFRVASITG
jgi:dolichol-phosphate mannosyltransferase